MEEGLKHISVQGLLYKSNAALSIYEASLAKNINFDLVSRPFQYFLDHIVNLHHM